MKKDFNLYPKDESVDVGNIYFEKDGKRINLGDIPPDPDILRVAKQYDKECSEKKQKQRKRKFACVAALVCVCLVTGSMISLDSCDALRLRIYQFFSNNETGSATLLAEDEYELIGDWEDYWYPNYLPEGFKLQDAAQSEFEKVMLFISENGNEIRIFERSLDADMNIDTDSTSVEEVKIGYQHGYILTNEQYDFITVCWLTDDRQISIEITNNMDKNDILQVAENMIYRE